MKGVGAFKTKLYAHVRTCRRDRVAKTTTMKRYESILQVHKKEFVHTSSDHRVQYAYYICLHEPRHIPQEELNFGRFALIIGLWFPFRFSFSFSAHQSSPNDET